jgi:hypothetical protein
MFLSRFFSRRKPTQPTRDAVEDVYLLSRAMPASRVALLCVSDGRRSVDAAAVWLETGGMDAVYVGFVTGFEIAGALTPEEDREDFLRIAAKRIAVLNGIPIKKMTFTLGAIPEDMPVRVGRPFACLPDALYYCRFNTGWKVALAAGHACAVRVQGREIKVWAGHGWPVRKYVDRSMHDCLEDALSREIHGYTFATL